MLSPKLSVIINSMGSSYLKEIVSTFLSSKQHVEVVVVIDDPTIEPKTLLPPEQIQDSRLILAQNEKNMGPTPTLNKAIALASGDIMVKADDDDLPAPDRLDEIAIFFATNPNVDLVYSFAKGVDVETGRTWPISGPTEHDAIQEKLLKRNFIVHSSVAFRRERLATISFYDESFRYALDYDFYLRALRAGLIFGCIPKYLVSRLYHSASITVAHRKRQILHSMAARLLHVAQGQENLYFWPVLRHYIWLLMIPNWARRLRRKFGLGK